ncbi:lipid export ABC transport protein [Capnocytophaga ochracea]|jgi:ABC transporter transmembrane region|uniref:Lipid export ABC transport protein n=1 Tax=Capnocytophaga ochracea TaxID=1018 RepID=A0A7Z8YBZ1_CAPOC|nr:MULTISPECIES: ABC transporter ATP-binding protein [Capnocytophaga]ALC97090.1 antibiotic ABC transporter ATP-binding protein [Capnocytophaga sp. oral taxon 323]EKY18209.1 ABC transporter transmembrane region [Capnocytophaga sp. oral taxon 324 str. F0483]MDU6659074.1 ABC transporter ATP-binding protein [Capnocytophaga sp.]MEB3036342.1 ABC transporter ATP-binding protein [Capnocytophaga ochracea]VDG81383.1 lipid export ABC transport protein [Capnocytophaga ochracea]
MSEKTSRTKHTFRQLSHFVKPYRGVFIAVALFAVLSSIFSTAQPYLIKVAIDNYITPKDYEGLVRIVYILIALLCAEVTMQFLFSYYSNWLGQTVIRDVREKLFAHLLRFKMRYFDKSSIGVLVTRAVNDMERIGEIFSSGLFEMASDILKMFVITIVMFVIDWKLALISYATMPLILYFTRWFQRSMNAAFVEVRHQVANLNAFVQERISGIKVLQLFAQEREELENFKKINEKHKQAWLKTIWYNSIFFPIGDLCVSITIALIVWFGGRQIIGDNVYDLGNIFLFIQLSQQLFRPIRHIADKFNTLQMGIIASDRVFAILDTETDTETGGEKELKEVKGNIKFEDVRFEYVAGEEILHGISFEVKEGETIAIVGATGAGKTTITNLLNRFYDLTSGAIYIDGVNIEEYTLSSLREHIATVLQDVFLFADSIYNNITLKNPAITEEEVIAAAKSIGVHNFLMSLPEGYHYNVKERGVMLSAGQRQLIAFLRAYVHKPQILILDEATSSVDSHSEKLIQEATDKMTEGRTSIIIAHRLTTVKKADRIIVLDKGKIVEIGNHEELLQIENGYYRNLYEVQFLEEVKYKE